MGLPRPRHSDQLHSDHLQLHIDGLQQPANPEPGPRHLVYRHIRLECGRRGGPQVKQQPGGHYKPLKLCQHRWGHRLKRGLILYNQHGGADEE